MTQENKAPTGYALHEVAESVMDPVFGWDPFEEPDLKPVTTEEAHKSLVEMGERKRKRELDEAFNSENASRKDPLPLIYFFPQEPIKYGQH